MEKLSKKVVWCWAFPVESAHKALKIKLQTAQNKLIRLLLNLPSRAHLTANHMISVGWLLVADRVQFLAMGLVYKMHYTTKIPMYLSRHFQNVKDVHHHNTRGSYANHVQPCLAPKKVQIHSHPIPPTCGTPYR